MTEQNLSASKVGENAPLSFLFNTYFWVYNFLGGSIEFNRFAVFLNAYLQAISADFQKSTT